MERPASASIPTTPGVYLYKDAGGRIVYVGKARNLRKRVLSYFRHDDQLTTKTIAMLRHAQTIETLSTTTEKEALLLEASLIKKHRPRYNIVLRDDKQYVLFRLALKSPFPRLEITRKVTKRDGARYFGPFTSAQAARETWKSIHRTFALRRCTDRAFKNRVKPCLYYHIGQCMAPCTGEINQADYAEIVQRISLLLSGKSPELLELLRTRMEEAADALNFEQAALLRDQMQAIEKTLERQGVVLQNGGDMDVLGIATRPDGLALGVLFVRQGMVLDRTTFFWPGLGLEEADELLWSFLGQFYKPSSAVPPRIVVPWILQDSQPESEQNLTAELFANSAASPAPCSEASAASLVEPFPEPSAENLPEHPHEHAMLEALEAALSDARGAPVRISAPRNPDEHRLVDMAKSNAREAARSKADLPIGERLGTLFHSEQPLNRIECIDVSHTGGTSTKVGMVVFEDGKPLKSDYRVWNIDDAHGDDYAALNTWAEHRLAFAAEHDAPWPDLMLIDGGKGQLATVGKVFRQALCSPASHPCSNQSISEINAVTETSLVNPLPFVLAGIAKARDEEGKADRRAGNIADRIFVPSRSNPLPFREGSPELLFLQLVRDTTHDFAIGRHRQARAKLALSGELQRLPGIGPHTSKLLWQQYPNLEAMRAATKAELATLPGIGPQKARKIWESLQAL